MGVSITRSRSLPLALLSALLMVAVAAPAVSAAAKTKRISVDSNGDQGNGDSITPKITPNGRWVVYESASDDLVHGDTNDKHDIFLRDRKKRKTKRVSVSSDGVQGNIQSNAYGVSNDGRYILFHSQAHTLLPNDTNGDWDVFIRDQKKRRTTRITRRSDGGQGEGSQPAWSADRRFIVFRSEHPLMVPNDTNLASDIFIRGPRG